MGGKKNKAFYRGGGGKRYGNSKLQPGMRGVMITCSMSGSMLQRACREVCDALTENAPEPTVVPIRVLPPGEMQEPEAKPTVQQESCEGEVTEDAVKPTVAVDDGGANEDNNDEDDIELDLEGALAKELSDMKEKATKGGQQRKRFLSVSSGCRGLEFIRFNDVQAADITHKLLTIAYKTKQSPCSLVSRIVPVTHSCKAHLKDIKRSAEDLLYTNFTSPYAPAVSYRIEFKARNNDSIKRDEILDTFNELITKRHRFERANPDFVVLIEILKTVCCMSVVRDYEKFFKYNMKKASATIQEDESDTTAATTLDADPSKKRQNDQMENELDDADRYAKNARMSEAQIISTVESEETQAETAKTDTSAPTSLTEIVSPTESEEAETETTKTETPVPVPI